MYDVLEAMQLPQKSEIVKVSVQISCMEEERKAKWGKKRKVIIATCRDFWISNRKKEEGVNKVTCTEEWIKKE